METKGLDDILSESGEQAPEPITEPKSEMHEASPIVDATGRLHHLDGKFAPKDKGEAAPVAEPGKEPEAAPPAAEQPKMVPLAAHEDERRKRQAVEARLQMLEDHFQRQAQPRQQAELPNFWDDPDTVLEQRLKQFGQSLLGEWQQMQLVQRLEASAASARAKHTDFDDMFQTFTEMEKLNPQLTQQAMASGDPMEFAYTAAKKSREVEQYGSLDQLIAAERAKWEAEVKASLSSVTAPITTAGQRSVGARSGPEWQGPAPLSDILASKPPG